MPDPFQNYLPHSYIPPCIPCLFPPQAEKELNQSIYETELSSFYADRYLLKLEAPLAALHWVYIREKIIKEQLTAVVKWSQDYITSDCGQEHTSFFFMEGERFWLHPVMVAPTAFMAGNHLCPFWNDKEAWSVASQLLMLGMGQSYIFKGETSPHPLWSRPHAQPTFLLSIVSFWGPGRNLFALHWLALVGGVFAYPALWLGLIGTGGVV